MVKQLKSLTFVNDNISNTYQVSSDTNPDWNQNDETAPDYIKNRTHYVGDPVETVLLEETSITTDGNSYVSDSVKLIEGYTYLVTFNGTEYECVAYCYDDWGIVIIGNGSLIDAEGGNGEPFAFVFMEGDGSDLITQEAGTYTLKIVGMIPEVVQLPAQFLMNSNVRNGEGEGSIIEGLDTAAIGCGSHAEGDYSTASGDFSHAEGQGTTASGDGSHSEGYETTASGNYSHAEGEYSTAFGDYSHAEGESARAFGRGSHAEGQSTYAIGYRAHSEGRYTVALGDYSHAEGYGNYASIRLTGDAGSTSYTVSDFYSTVAIGDFIAAGDAWSIVAGYDASTKTITLESTLNANRAFNREYASLYSSGIASGRYSHSEGYQTVASGNNSHAEGYNTIASGTYGAHAEGNEATASGMQSHAEGAYTIAQGNTSHAEGYATKANGEASHAEGLSCIASGQYSHAENESTTASGRGSHAEGLSADALGDYSHAEGYYTTANTAYLNVTGTFNLTEDLPEYVFTQTRTTAGFGATEICYKCSEPPVFNAETGAYEVTSITEITGENIQVGDIILRSPDNLSEYYEIMQIFYDGKNQIYHCQAYRYSPMPTSTVRGKYAHIIGNGTSDTARSNAHTVDWNGLGWFAGGLKVGGTGQDDTNAVEVATLANSEDWIFTLEDGSTVTKKVVLG